MNNVIVETSWDDGDILDLKLAGLMSKYHIPGTFYIPIERRLPWRDVLTLSKEFEIGSHTVTHPHDMKMVVGDELFFEVQSSKEMWEAILCRPCKKFCYPRGRYDDFTVEAVKKAGYEEARTTIVGYFNPPQDPFRKHTTVHVAPRKEYNGTSWYDMALAAMDIPTLRYFHLWGHSWEIERHNAWRELEVLFKIMKQKFKL